MAEPKVVRFCTQVGYINSSNRMTYQPQNGCSHGHVTVLKLQRVAWVCRQQLSYVYNLLLMY